MSSAFEKFKESYSKRFGRDGPDLSLLDEMDEKEREKVETLLLRKLKPTDIDFIQILGYLRSQRAFTPLVEMLPNANDVSQVYIANALWRIRRYDPALSLLCQTLMPGSIIDKFIHRGFNALSLLCQTLMPGSLASNDARIMAAIMLGEIPEESAIRALSFAIKDNEYLVRYHAQRSLAVLLGLQEKLKALEQEMTGPFQERQRAAEKLKQLVESALHDFLSKQSFDQN
jgi:HEAT repeat protein